VVATVGFSDQPVVTSSGNSCVNCGAGTGTVVGGKFGGRFHLFDGKAHVFDGGKAHHWLDGKGGKGAGADRGKPPHTQPGTVVFPQHPFARSPRDYFMVD